MATETFTRLVDDLDGSKAERTVAFSWDGKSYSIDLSRKNIAALERSLQPFIAAARRTHPSRQARGRGRRTARGGAIENTRDSRLIREWARANGYQVSDRGRIGAEIITAYQAAR
jgi:hypothetical protein